MGHKIKNRKSRILIVDDNVSNIDVLANLLQPLYNLMVAMNGQEALDCCFKKNKPDLILLDIMMPGIDGYEVCRQLKEQEKTKDIPIIFVTARSNEDDEVMGFEAGAIDFIVKPVQELTLLARVATHLELSNLRTKLRGQVEKRTEKLQRANARLKDEIERHKNTSNALRGNEIMAMRNSHLASLGSIAAGMAHEINNPNSFISLNIPLLNDIFNGIMEYLSENQEDINIGSLSHAKIKTMVPTLLSGIEEGSRRIDYIINHLKKFSMQDQENVKVETDINLVIEDSIMLLINEIKKRSINVQKNFGRIPSILINRYQIEQVFMNIMQNAVESSKDGHRSICISTCIDNKLQNVLVEIKDNGHGIDLDIANRIFEPFFTTKLSKGGTGLGLPVSHKIISEHGGSIEVESGIGQWTIFTVALPL